jgi:hypothetical protein
MSAAERFGAPHQIRLSQLSIFNPPPRRSLMAVVIKGYFDDSRSTAEGLWVVAGFVGFVDQWEEFEQDWRLLLDTHGIPYLHMKEMGKPGGVYKCWQPASEHYAEMAAFFGDVAKVIGRCNLEGFGGFTRTHDVDKFNAENNLCLEPYPLAVYGSLIALWKRHEREPIELLFDHVEQVQSKLCRAKQYADSDQNYANDFDAIQMIPLNKRRTFKDVVELQIADFLAWEWRKLHLDREGWWAKTDKPTGWDARWNDFEAWMEREKPRTRKSILALMERANFTGFIWDYDHLCEAHKLRGGVWA